MQLIDPNNISPFDLSNSVNLQGKHFPEGTIAELTIKAFCRTPCVGDKGEETLKNAILFAEVDKPMVLNETKLATLKKLFGPMVREWIGKKVGLRQGSVLYRGEMKCCIVLEAPPLQTSPSASTTVLPAPTPSELDEFARWKAQQTATVRA